jgi:hypothetical protein
MMDAVIVVWLLMTAYLAGYIVWRLLHWNVLVEELLLIVRRWWKQK